MALTDEQRDEVRANLAARWASVTITRADGTSETVQAPIGRIDYLDLSAIDLLLRRLGYRVDNVRRGDALFAITPLTPGEGG